MHFCVCVQNSRRLRAAEQKKLSDEALLAMRQPRLSLETRVR